MKITHVVLADDHAVVRAGIRHILMRIPAIEIIGEACNGAEAIDLVNQLKPDVLLLDIEMPVLNGLEVVRQLHAENSPVRILALSTYDDYQYITQLLRSGAAGYLTKDEALDSIVEAIQSVARGEKGWISRRAAAKLATRNANRSKVL